MTSADAALTAVYNLRAPRERSPIIDPLHDLRTALDLEGTLDASTVHLDFGRGARTGKPEVVMAEGKDPAVLVEIVRSMLDTSGVAILSRMRPRLVRVVQLTFPDEEIRDFPASHMLVVRRPGETRPETGGRVGIITAGTSDVPVAEQVQVIASEMGCQVFSVYDVGVAGIHRLVGPLRGLFEAEVDVIVVAAGMDGALPSVVAGLVDVPVIGVPTSTGYGLGGKGIAALLSMLQTCAPGLVAVNIDNGVGAGTTAALIANRVAAARGEKRSGTSSTDAA